MSPKERKRIPIMAGVKARQLSLVQATDLLQVGYRQCKRIWRRYQAEGDAGLVHRLRGRPSARRKPAALRTQVLARCREERFADFGPTLLAEHLAKAKLVVDHETLRRWLLLDGQRSRRRRQAPHRQWRERKACFGAMIQLDGSHHDWLEGRGPKCVAMVMVDDATNRLHVRFCEQETTRASFDVFEDWVGRHGLPASLYVDRDSIYRCESQPSLAEQLAGTEPQTQFGRAMAALGVELILAYSPQAKGRVERMNGLLQDRLVKELRLAGIDDIAQANRFLQEKFLPAYHRRFLRQPASPVDLHRPAPKNLAEALSWEVERVVQADWTVACDGQRYQLDRQHAALSLVRRKVIVRTLRTSQVQLLYRGQRLRSRLLPASAPHARGGGSPRPRARHRDGSFYLSLFQVVARDASPPGQISCWVASFSRWTRPQAWPVLESHPHGNTVKFSGDVPKSDQVVTWSVSVTDKGVAADSLTRGFVISSKQQPPVRPALPPPPK